MVRRANTPGGGEHDGALAPIGSRGPRNAPGGSEVDVVVEEKVSEAYQPQAGADEPHSRAATPPLPQAGANTKLALQHVPAPFGSPCLWKPRKCVSSKAKRNKLSSISGMKGQLEMLTKPTSAFSAPPDYSKPTSPRNQTTHNSTATTTEPRRDPSRCLTRNTSTTKPGATPNHAEIHIQQPISTYLRKNSDSHSNYYRVQSGLISVPELDTNSHPNEAQYPII